ncbi:hypothetical protein ABW19_dt0208912 [Dactylella cylindrospora]|nr:hypothetical protein ABW19_dt0208912 [Dactylella cylindrospora]
MDDDSVFTTSEGFASPKLSSVSPGGLPEDGTSQFINELSAFRLKQRLYFYLSISLTAEFNEDWALLEVSMSRVITITKSLCGSVPPQRYLKLALAKYRLGDNYQCLVLLAQTDRSMLRVAGAFKSYNLETLAWLKLGQLDTAELASLQALEFATNHWNHPAISGERFSPDVIHAIIMDAKGDHIEAAFYKSLVPADAPMDPLLSLDLIRSFNSIIENFWTTAQQEGEVENEDEVTVELDMQVTIRERVPTNSPELGQTIELPQDDGPSDIPTELYENDEGITTINELADNLINVFNRIDVYLKIKIIFSLLIFFYTLEKVVSIYTSLCMLRISQSK